MFVTVDELYFIYLVGSCRNAWGSEHVVGFSQNLLVVGRVVNVVLFASVGVGIIITAVVIIATVFAVGVTITFGIVATVVVDLIVTVVGAVIFVADVAVVVNGIVVQGVTCFGIKIIVGAVVAANVIAVVKDFSKQILVVWVRGIDDIRVVSAVIVIRVIVTITWNMDHPKGNQRS